jgi:hypothetical protein
MIQATSPANKYTRGRYAVCPSCGSRPCAPDCEGNNAPANPEPLAELRPRSSGNAIPFEAFDHYQGLPAAERLLLLYLCRLTLGYGHHTGDLLSLGQIVARSGLSLTVVKRALNGLESRGLIARSRRFERASRERGTTHIQVVFPSEVGPERTEVGPNRANLVGPNRANGRSKSGQRSVQIGPYLKASPKSLSKKGDHSRGSLHHVQLQLL